MMKASVLLLSVAALLFTSCDFILKKDEEPPVNYSTSGSTEIIDLDGDACSFQAGYRWSELREDCIRVFEEGFRLNPINLNDGNPEENELEDNDVSCFLIYNAKKNKAEVFLPSKTKSLVLEQKNTQGLYSNEGWELDNRKGLTLRYKNEIKFTAAKTIELKVIGTDEVFSDFDE